jgi:tetratricopeptide (TPR) repeat protein
VLFDLQSPRRRRVIRVTFGALAAIFAISFVFLGVGTGGGGFSFSDLFGGGSSSSTANAFDDDIKTAEQQIAVNPADTAALARLVQLNYSKANVEVDDQGRPTSDGVQDLQQSVEAWSKYQKAAGSNVAIGPALIAYQAYFILAQSDFSDVGSASTASEQLQGLHSTVADLKGAAEAQKVVASARPNLANWAKVAQAYALAGDKQRAQEAIAEAKKVNPKGSAQLEKQLKSVQQRGDQFTQAINQLTKQQQKSQGGAPGAAGAGGGNPLSGLGTGGL